MIPIEQVDRMIAEAVSQAVAEVRAQMQDALDQAKLTIRSLLAQIHGVRAETIQVVLSDEHQQHIDATWGGAKDVTPAPAPTEEVEPKTVRRPRDRRGLAQRYPGLPIQEAEAKLAPELQEQVAQGTVQVRRSGKYQDELVAPQGQPFLRRVFEMELVRVGSDVPLVRCSPDRVVDGGDLADETIHRFMEEKFLDAIPFHRQLAQLSRQGVDIPKQTVNDAANAWGDLFSPLALAIMVQVLASPVVHADASWLRVQEAGGCDRLNLWTLVGGGQVAYRITDDLRHERASELIPPTFKGRLVGDAWPGWSKLNLAERLGLCNAHARRPFAAWLKREGSNADARSIVTLYAQVYRIEHEADDGPPAELLDRRRRLRNERTRPVMTSIHAEAVRIASSYHRSHPLADGARYIIDHWPGLTRFLDDPLLPPDNNAAENALRINALIRKNSLFNGSGPAAIRDAVALTVLHSCRLQKILPADYLAKVTPALLLHRRGRKQDLASLTPAEMLAAGQATTVR
jgi:transposase